MKLIADSGSTKTNWALISSPEVQKFKSIGLNPHFLNGFEIIIAIKETFDKVNIHSVTEIYFYGTGITGADKIDLLKEALNRVFPLAQAFIYSDIIGAARSVFGEKRGLIGILGTGANTGFFDGKEISKQILPLGFWLGDEGSGAYLGKELIKSYLRKELPDSILKAFENTFGKIDRLDVFKEIKENERPNYYFASFVPFLKKNLGNEHIRSLVRNAFTEFYNHSVLPYTLNASVKIGIVGSVGFHFKDVLLEVLDQILPNEIEIVADPLPGLICFHS